MYILTKGYKQGRAVSFYDLSEINGALAKEKVDKDTVVKMCNEGQIGNAKIQMWEGKPIVRCSNKNLPLVKLDKDGTVIGEAEHIVRSGNSGSVSHRQSKPVEVQVRSKVVGKVEAKKHKENIKYTGYDIEAVKDSRAGASQIQLTKADTLGDLFDYIAKDFNVRRMEEYKAEFAKKVDINRPVTSYSHENLSAITQSIASYLMNMVYQEVSDVYVKYAC